jgi:hypothetical protein
MAPLPLCVYGLAAEPPAHFRLVSDRDLFEIVVIIDCTAPASTEMLRGRGERHY